ncbi:MAG: CoA pyrophosphatase [Pseudomonadota bacterium]
MTDHPFRLNPVFDATSDFDFHQDLRPKNRSLKDAAVLVPLQKRDGIWTVLLTKRSAQLAHHPGQIAFPGGKVDPSDGSALNAALREAEEEIGLPQNAVFVLGTLPTHETVTGFQVHPYIATIPADFVPIPEAYEVDEVFSVPLSHLSDPANFAVRGRPFMGVERRYYAVPFGPYYIWGATARMLRMMCDCLEIRDEC